MPNPADVASSEHSVPKEDPTGTAESGRLGGALDTGNKQRQITIPPHAAWLS